jgi:ArsR family transcriptional regulator, arsenate/arsenite/antimonite-responsive transcriptional repressor
METKTVIQALAALAQESRLAIFRLLVEAGPAGLTVGVIAARLRIANATLSFHLKELTNAGLTIASPQGRSIVYATNFLTMNALVAYLTENCCAGTDCVSPVNCAPPNSAARVVNRPEAPARAASVRATADRTTASRKSPKKG